MLDFPANPTVGQQFTAAGVTWFWDGVKWLPSGLSPTIVPGINDNRIINGDCRIDQRNNGAGSQAINTYTIDRWFYQASLAGVGTWIRGTGPSSVGFPYCLSYSTIAAHVSVAIDTFAFYQAIEADMVSDFMWGTANAQPATLSFWASSSVTGTFSGAIQNAAETRSYPFSFTISTTGAFAKFVIPIPGDTSGAWVMSGNANSMYVMFDIGNGANFRGPANAWASANYWGVTGSIRATTTNGVALNITGVKLEIGSVVTPYNRQSLAKSMADCQRYYSQTNGNALISATAAGQFLATSVVFPVTMRAIPTVTTGTIAGDVNLTSFNIDNITAIGCRAYSGAAAAGTAQFVRYFNANAEL